MAQASMPPMERTTSEIDYQPLSGVAVAAIIVSGIYVLVVAFIAIIALYTRKPIYSPLPVIPAVFGLGLAIAARAHINRSEGTRSGMHLASAAWWMSVIGGAGFGAYYFASYTVLSKDSRAECLKWFDLLKEGKIDQAYLETEQPTRRSNINPDDKQAMEANFPKLPGFRNSELVHFFNRNGKDVEIESQGIGMFEQVPEGCRVDTKYRLKSAEGLFEINLILVGMEGPNIQGRQWFIANPEGLTAKKRTTYGRLIKELEDEAEDFCRQWSDRVGQNLREVVYLDTLGPTEREALINEMQAASSNMPARMLGLGSMAMPRLVKEMQSKLKVNPSDKEAVLAELQRRNFLQLLGLATDEKKAQLIESWKLGIVRKSGLNRQVSNTETSSQLTITPDAVVYAFPIEIQLHGVSPVSFAKGRITAECRTPELVKELNELKAKGAGNAENADNSREALLQSRPPRNWRILKLETDLEPLAAPPKPGGRGAAPPAG